MARANREIRSVRGTTRQQSTWLGGLVGDVIGVELIADEFEAGNSSAIELNVELRRRRTSFRTVHECTVQNRDCDDLKRTAQRQPHGGLAPLANHFELAFLSGGNDNSVIVEACQLRRSAVYRH